MEARIAPIVSEAFFLCLCEILNIPRKCVERFLKVIRVDDIHSRTGGCVLMALWYERLIRIPSV